MKLPCKIKVKYSDIIFDVYQKSRGSKLAIIEWYNEREEFKSNTYEIKDIKKYIKDGDWLVVDDKEKKGVKV